MSKEPEAFKTISEVASELDLPQHVLRFWETRFKQIKPMKRGGGRRYYRPDDLSLLQGIRHLLYSEGYTIKGVQRILKEQGSRAVMAAPEGGFTQPSAPAKTAVPINEIAASQPAAAGGGASAQGDTRATLQAALSQLLECKRLLDQVR